MARRPVWSGHLRVSLVSCPVHLYPGVSRSERVSFHLLNPKTQNRIQMRPVDAETGDALERDALVKGYEYEKGRFVVVDPDEIDKVEIESSRTIDLDRFVAEDEVDTVYLDTPYYLVPDSGVAEETFRVVHEAMRGKARAGLGRVVLSGREHGVLVRPHDRCMLLTTLRPAPEVVGDKAYCEGIAKGALSQEMVELATRIIEQKSGDFDPRAWARDRYQEALQQLVTRKLKGEKISRPKPREPAQVINLMDALKRSLGSGGKPAAAPKRSGNAARTHKAATKAGTHKRRGAA